MAFHLLAWSSNPNTTSFIDTTPVPDQIMAIQNAHFFPDRPLKIAWGIYIAAHAQRARIVTPSIRQFTSNNILFGANRAATYLTQQRVSNFLDNPVQLQPLEEITLETQNDTGGAERQNALMGVFDSILEQAPGGNTFVASVTSTTAAVASVWTDLTATFDVSLPNGKFAIVGMRHNSASGIACRMILPNATNGYRPGCVSSINVYDDVDPLFRRGGLGKWGEFVQSNLPRFQVLCNTTDNAHEILLDLIRIG